MTQEQAQERLGADGRPEHAGNLKAQRINELNATMRYAMWTVFRVSSSLRDLDQSREEAASELAELLDEAQRTRDVTTRGIYDVAGFRADADFMIWTHAESTDDLQLVYSKLRQSALGSHLEPVWSQVALHRPAEFNRSHLPAFLADEKSRDYICVYPFVRSYEWYLLPDEERRDMLREHGQMARPYEGVRANTVSSFALGDYEWMLAFESDELDKIVDLMRDLRASGARRHVREETPFYTGRRVTPAQLLERLP
ncbi:chlorite dismutase family protein [Epidermidibacterium keratini]|nr:hydrogen peroxide-dependent heme synthase [Epidermidibacterium keratini]